MLYLTSTIFPSLLTSQLVRIEKLLLLCLLCQSEDLQVDLQTYWYYIRPALCEKRGQTGQIMNREISLSFRVSENGHTVWPMLHVEAIAQPEQAQIWRLNGTDIQVVLML